MLNQEKYGSMDFLGGALLFIIIIHNFVQPFLQLASLRPADTYTVLTENGYIRWQGINLANRLQLASLRPADTFGNVLTTKIS